MEYEVFRIDCLFNNRYYYGYTCSISTFKRLVAEPKLIKRLNNKLSADCEAGYPLEFQILETHDVEYKAIDAVEKLLAGCVDDPLCYNHIATKPEYKKPIKFYVYIVTNDENGKYYIGSTKSMDMIQRRLDTPTEKRHLSTLVYEDQLKGHKFKVTYEKEYESVEEAHEAKLSLLTKHVGKRKCYNISSSAKSGTLGKRIEPILDETARKTELFVRSNMRVSVRGETYENVKHVAVVYAMNPEDVRIRLENPLIKDWYYIKD